MGRRGHDRERQVRLLLEADDWFVVRAAGSLGDADLVALKDGRRPRLIEVKSSSKERGPYADFGPQDRSEFSFAARLAGAEAWLIWWPPHGKPHWIAEFEWPQTFTNKTNTQGAHHG